MLGRPWDLVSLIAASVISQFANASLWCGEFIPINHAKPVSNFLLEEVPSYFENAKFIAGDDHGALPKYQPLMRYSANSNPHVLISYADSAMALYKFNFKSTFPWNNKPVHLARSELGFAKFGGSRAIAIVLPRAAILLSEDFASLALCRSLSQPSVFNNLASFLENLPGQIDELLEDLGSHWKEISTSQEALRNFRIRKRL